MYRSWFVDRCCLFSVALDFSFCLFESRVLFGLLVSRELLSGFETRKISAVYLHFLRDDEKLSSQSCVVGQVIALFVTRIVSAF